MLLLLTPDGPLQRFFELIEVDTGAVIRGGVRVAAIWFLDWLSWGALRIIARRIEKAVDDGDDSTLTAAEKRGQTIAQLLRSVGSILIIIVAALLSLNLFIDIGPL